MNLRTRLMIIGGVLGASLGVLAAHLYLQATPVTVDEEGREELPAVQPGKALTASVGVLTALRQITGMGKG